MGGLLSGKRKRDPDDEGPRACELPRFEAPAASPRFDVEDPAAMDYLREHGYVVVAAALDADEVAAARGHFWDFVEASSNGCVQRGAPQTWGDKLWGGGPQNGLFEAGGIGQSAFLWYVRSKPKVLRAFQEVWSVADPSDLLVSFDGCCAFRPTSVDASWRTMGGWYHVDQNGRATGLGRTCVQGFVSLFDQDATTGGLAVLPGSHARFKGLFGDWSDCRKGRDFCILPWDDPMLVGASAIRPRLVHAGAGDLVLWDSRCVHCNAPAWHPFDEEPLERALAAAGLAGVDPVLRPGSSVATAVWAWQNSDLRHADLEPRFASLLQQWAGSLKTDLEGAVSSPPARGPQLLRLVAYVCALPRERAPPRVLEEKRRAVLLGATTTHWPDRAEFKSYAAGSPGLLDVEALPRVALRLAGCEGPDPGSMRAQLRRQEG